MNASKRTQRKARGITDPCFSSASVALGHPAWPLWREEISRLITAVPAARRNLETLVKAKCNRDELLFRLAAVLAWHGHRVSWRDTRMSLHLVKAAPKKMREVAGMIERFRDVLSMRALNAGLSRKILEAADELQQGIPFLLSRNGLSMELAAMCTLVGYVKCVTNANYDSQVSALLGAVMAESSYAATNLTQWRSKHKRDIDLMGSALVNPLSRPVPLT